MVPCLNFIYLPVIWNVFTHWPFIFLFCELKLAYFCNVLIFQAGVGFAVGIHFPSVLGTEMVFAVDYNILPG